MELDSPDPRNPFPALPAPVAALLLAIPIALAVVARGPVSTGSVRPDHRPVTPATLAERGELRFAVEDRTMAYFIHRGERRGFEFELLERYARDHGAVLVPVVAASAGEAAALLRAERVDVALLPWTDEVRIVGGRRAQPYLLEDGTQFHFPETGAPFVRDDSPELLAGIDGYLRRSPSVDVARLFERYFVDNHRFRAVRVAGRWMPVPPSISSYDTLIAKHANEAGLDWRLVSSLIFEESSFNPRAVSPKGARGLMQLMPAAAQDVGLDRPHAPEENIRAGVAYLRRLSEMFGESAGEDHLRTVVAAYLLGPGPIIDAQKIAAEIGLEPTRWKGGIEETLPLLESEDWTNRIRFAGSKGSQAVGYVNRIFRRFDDYRRQVGETPAETAAIARRDRPA